MKEIKYDINDLPEDIRKQFEDCEEEEYLLTDRVPYLKFLKENIGRTPKEFVIAYYLQFGKKIDENDLNEYKESYYNAKYSYTHEDIIRAKTLKKKEDIVEEKVKPITVESAIKEVDTIKQKAEQIFNEPLAEEVKEEPDTVKVIKETVTTPVLNTNGQLDVIETSISKIVEEIIKFVESRSDASFRLCDLYTYLFPLPVDDLFKDSMYKTLVSCMSCAQQAGQLKNNGVKCKLNTQKYDTEKFRAAMYKGMITSSFITNQRKVDLINYLYNNCDENVSILALNKFFFMRQSAFRKLVGELLDKPVRQRKKKEQLL